MTTTLRFQAVPSKTPTCTRKPAKLFSARCYRACDSSLEASNIGLTPTIAHYKLTAIPPPKMSTILVVPHGQNHRETPKIAQRNMRTTPPFKTSRPVPCRLRSAKAIAFVISTRGSNAKVKVTSLTHSHSTTRVSRGVDSQSPYTPRAPAEAARVSSTWPWTMSYPSNAPAPWT